MRWYGSAISVSSRGAGPLTGTPEPSGGTRTNREAACTDGEHAGSRLVEERAAPQHRARNPLVGLYAAAPSKAADVIAGNRQIARPIRAAPSQLRPVAHKLPRITHHVEDAPHRLAVAARACEGKCSRVRVAIRRPRVGARVWRAGCGTLPLLVAQKPLA